MENLITIGATYSEALGRIIDQLIGEQPSDYFIFGLEILLGIAYLLGTIYIFKYIISEFKINISGMFGKLFKKKEKGKSFSGEDSRKLAVQVLKSLGCPILSEKETIRFRYSGEDFVLNPFHAHFLWVFTYLGYINLSDSEEDLQTLKEAVNTLNRERFFPSYTYEEDVENNSLCVYGGITTLFRKEVPNLEQLLLSYLDSLLEAKKEIIDKFHLIKEQKEKQKRVVVKGFSPKLENESGGEEK